MGFYWRKAINLGPFRLNFSKGGMGTSFGIKGARIGRNAKGKTYGHFGMGGLYYRHSFEKRSKIDLNERNLQGWGNPLSGWQGALKAILGAILGCFLVLGAMFIGFSLLFGWLGI